LNNQEAVVLGVQKWMDNNSAIVERALIKGAEAATIEIAEAVGSKIANKMDKWLQANHSEIVTALAGQMAIGALAEVPGLNKRLKEQELKAMEVENEG
jgi:hypothetical protein